MKARWDLENNRIAYAQTNPDERENYLAEHRTFVFQVASNYCKKNLQWGRDDELSVALIAFNDAISVYDAEREVPFLAFARRVMQNRITDHIRKETRHKYVSLEPDQIEGLPSQGEIRAAWDNYNQTQVEVERAGELEQYQKRLEQFGLTFTDLVSISPKHRDARETLMQAAQVICASEGMRQSLWRKKQLPIKELSLASGIHLKTLERGRKYIIAVAIILCNSDEFLHLRSYIKFPKVKEGQ